jgi:hypothetical protein
MIPMRKTNESPETLPVYVKTAVITKKIPIKTKIHLEIARVL